MSNQVKNYTALRDVAANNYFVMGYNLTADKYLPMAYKAGFDQCHKLMSADLEMLKTALEVYAMTNDVFPESGAVAREALAKYEESK